MYKVNKKFQKKDCDLLIQSINSFFWNNTLLYYPYNYFPFNLQRNVNLLKN